MQFAMWLAANTATFHVVQLFRMALGFMVAFAARYGLKRWIFRTVVGPPVNV